MVPAFIGFATQSAKIGAFAIIKRVLSALYPRSHGRFASTERR
jgi:hypothetical protein